MRRLKYYLDFERINSLKSDLVPTIFTEHQFTLIKKKCEGKNLTNSEKAEFSRSISKKMNAVSKYAGEEEGYYAYGSGEILPQRKNRAKNLLKSLSRKYKGKHIIISGSYLFSMNYNDIDIFIISKYEKDDVKERNIHISYLNEDVYSSLFFASLKQICISNKDLSQYFLDENHDPDKLISLFQEISSDYALNPHSFKTTLREFSIYASYIGNKDILNGKQLNIQVSSILKLKNPISLIRQLFISSYILGVEKRKRQLSMTQMIQSYKDLIKQYSKHKTYYMEMIETFKKVIAIGN